MTIEDVQNIASAHGGRCLSTSFSGVRVKLTWECSEGHQWQAQPRHIARGGWCPFCRGVAKHTIEQMRALAQSRGGRCLSTRYINSHANMIWQCSNGHVWKAAPSDVLLGRWCRRCAAEARRNTLDQMKHIAAAKGGKCLSDSYTTTNTKLLWECAKGHQWWAKPTHVKAGHWCPYCAHRARGTIDEMRMLAKSRGGTCLSTVYRNANTKLQWKCAKGHTWHAAPAKIRLGRWCPECAVEKRASLLRLGLAKMQELAQQRGGKCLSKEYRNTTTELHWECASGHRWWNTPAQVKRGTWCRICSETAVPTIDDMRTIASQRGGRCLATEYLGAQTKLTWECAVGHRWQAVPNSIQRGSWCPECSTGLGERICRAFFEQLFEVKFPTEYPRWLVNEEGHQMELDGYCPSLGIAFEHQGEQHFSRIKHFERSGQSLTRRQVDDALKTRLCSEHQVLLIQVPAIPGRLPIREIPNFIKTACEANGKSLPKLFLSKRVDLKKAYVNRKAIDQLELLREIAASRGGACLSTGYVNSVTKLTWQCANGHRWRATPSDIKTGCWCRACAGTVRSTIAQMRQLAPNGSSAEF